MDEIVKVDKRSFNALLQVDLEANHHGSGNFSKKEKMKELKDRFDKRS